MKLLVFCWNGEVVYTCSVAEVRPGEADEMTEAVALECGAYAEDITWHVEEMGG